MQQDDENIFASLHALHVERQQAARQRVEQETHKYFNNFDALTMFNVDAFCQDLAMSLDLPTIQVIPGEVAETMGGAVVAEVSEQKIRVADATVYPREVPLTRDVQSAEHMYDTICSMMSMKSTPVVMPVCEFKMQPINRQRTFAHTEVVLTKLADQVEFIDPDPSTLAFCKRTSRVFYVTPKFEYEPCALAFPIADLPTRESVRRMGKRSSDKKVVRPMYLGYTSYEDLSKYKYACGMVFNPYRRQSQVAIRYARREPDKIVLKYEIHYRKYQTNYPVNPLTQYPHLTTLCVDRWPVYLGIPHSKIHPKWYYYDYVTTTAIDHVQRDRIVLTDLEFINPRIRYMSKDKDSESRVMELDLYPSTGIQERGITEFTLYSKAHTRTFKFVTRTVQISELNVIESRPEKLIVMRGTTRYEYICSMYIPHDPTIFVKYYKYYQIVEKKKGVKMFYVDVTVFREYSNVEGAYVDDIRILDLISAIPVYRQKDIRPFFRDYICAVGDMYADDLQLELVQADQEFEALAADYTLTLEELKEIALVIGWHQ